MEGYCKIKDPAEYTEHVRRWNNDTLASGSEMGADIEALMNNIAYVKSMVEELNGNILLRTYPVGSIYISTADVNPGTLFGGTWVSWGSGRMPVGVNAADPNFNGIEKAGGSASHTHASPQHTHGINSHSHTIAHTHTINSHSHAMPHTHTINNHAHTTGDCTLTVNQMPSHEHKLFGIGYDGESTYPNHYRVGFGTVGLRDNIRTVAVGGGQAHNHGSTGGSGVLTSNGSSAANTGGSGTLTSNASSAANTGGSALTTNNNTAGNTGSSSSLPPYITCHMWKRVA